MQSRDRCQVLIFGQLELDVMHSEEFVVLVGLAFDFALALEAVVVDLQALDGLDGVEDLDALDFAEEMVLEVGRVAELLADQLFSAKDHNPKIIMNSRHQVLLINLAFALEPLDLVLIEPLDPLAVDPLAHLHFLVGQEVDADSVLPA